MTNTKAQLANLMQAIQLLAADSDTQVSHFPKFVHVPDELALTYNDSLLLVEQLMSTELISQHQQAKLKQLDSILEQMSQVQRLWTVTALKKASEWQKIRLLAKDLLSVFSQKPQIADLSWMNYAEGAIPTSATRKTAPFIYPPLIPALSQRAAATSQP